MGTITKRTDSKGKTAYMARVRRRGYPHITQTFPRRTDAAAWISQQEVKIRQGLYLDDVEATRHTLKEAIDRYTEEFECDVNRRCHLRRWSEVLGSRLMSSIDDVLISDGLSQIKPLGGRTTNNRLAPGSVRVHLCSLSAVFKSARRWGWVKKNPVRDVERPGQGKIRVRYLDRDELKRLLTACKESRYKPLYLIVMLALSTGMRKEEILSLKWRNVELDRERIILEQTKNGDRRNVPVKGEALSLLKDYAKVRRIDTDFLFPGEKPSPQKECKAVPAQERHFDITAAWNAARKAAQLVDFRFHDLRHTAASYLAMNGATIADISGVLGHRGVATTQRYAHLSDSHLADRVESMNRRFINGNE
jgi:integrase